MANQTLHYDTQAIRRAASDIRAKIKNYKAANDSVTATVTDMKQYWDDAVNQNFVARYYKDLKVTAENVSELMEAFAKFLDEVAEAYDRAVKNANAGING